MSSHPRIRAVAAATPPYSYTQDQLCRATQRLVLDADDPRYAVQAAEIAHLFSATGVERRQSAVDVEAFYRRRRSTGERMGAYGPPAYQLGRMALAAAVDGAVDGAVDRAASAVGWPVQDSPAYRLPDEDSTAAAPQVEDITDLIVVSCTGYAAPGLDIMLARDLGLRPDVRRIAVGHMGCYGAIVGLRQALGAVRAYPRATAALLCVELCTLHFAPTLDRDMLTSCALFGDGAAALVLTRDPDARGPEVVDTYCVADFATAEQMSWTIGDEGFAMTLSPRVPVTLRRAVGHTVANLLAPHGLRPPDVAHWIIHPGGPSILDVIQGRLELTDEQMAPSWQVFREHGNCSSVTVLLILDRLLRRRQPRPGEWGVMMAFGPGLTLETCLLRF